MGEHVTTPSDLAEVASFIGIEFAAWRWVRQVANSIQATWTITAMLFMAIFASLYFMWSVRHTKTE